MTVVGGNKAKETVIAGDKLWSYDALTRIAGQLPLPPGIMQTKDILSDKVFR